MLEIFTRVINLHLVELHSPFPKGEGGWLSLWSLQFDIYLFGHPTIWFQRKAPLNFLIYKFSITFSNIFINYLLSPYFVLLALKLLLFLCKLYGNFNTLFVRTSDVMLSCLLKYLVYLFLILFNFLFCCFSANVPCIFVFLSLKTTLSYLAEYISNVFIGYSPLIYSFTFFRSYVSCAICVNFSHIVFTHVRI